MNRTARVSSGEARALLVLDELPGVGPHAIQRLVGVFGSAERALAGPFGTFARAVGREAALARSDSEVARRVDDGLDLARRLGMTMVTWNDAEYPFAVSRLADPPPVLFLRGNPSLLGRGGVAVVGSRRCTARAKDLARRLAGRLAGAGVAVVSGMALGVDGAAHAGALEAGGETIAVVGRGADAPYPASHRRLFKQIVDRGLVVGEFLPGTPPLPHHFPRRNRIMAALAEVVVVVEAGARSGALITVEHGLDLGRDVWAVPGPIDTPACRGSNRLLAEGATPLVSIERFVREVTGDAAVVTRDSDVAESEVALAAPERLLLQSLDRGPLHVDELSAETGITVSVALALLVQLELRGAVEQMPGHRFRAA